MGILCLSNFDCVNNAECLKGQCYCRDGFEAVGAVCRDENECLASPCGPNAQCQNIPGSFQCTCNAGFLGNPPESACKGRNGSAVFCIMMCVRLFLINCVPFILSPVFVFCVLSMYKFFFKYQS